MNSILTNFKSKEAEFLDAKNKLHLFVQRILFCWNQIYSNKVNVNIDNCSFSEENGNFLISESYVDRYSWDMDFENITKTTVYSIPFSFIDNIEFFEKHLPFIQELYNLRKERRDLSRFYVYGIDVKIDKKIGTIGHIQKQAGILGHRINEGKKLGLDVSSLIKEHKIYSEQIKSFKEKRNIRIKKLRERAERMFHSSNAKRLKEVKDRIKVLEALIGNNI